MQMIDTELSEELLQEVLGFYGSCGRNTTLEPTNKLVLARQHGQIVGVVRLCFEEGYWLLRTMQVAKVLQGQGIGLNILKCFEDLLQAKGISLAYCMAYSHLERFYGTIGFAPIPKESAPLFLRERARAALARDPGLSLLFLRRDEP